MRQEFKKLNWTAELLNLRNMSGKDVQLEEFSTIMVGASIRNGKIETYISDWVMKHSKELNQKQSAFFEVSWAAAVDKKDPNYEKAKSECKTMIERFLQEAGWKPTCWTAFGGCLAFSKAKTPEDQHVLKIMAMAMKEKFEGDKDIEKTGLNIFKGNIISHF